MELFTERADTEKALEFLRKEGVSEDTLLIGFQPGASTVSRQWFPERFMRLGKDLLEAHPGARIVLTGSPGEATLCKKIADGIGNSTIVAAGKLPLKQVPPLIKRLGVLVTGDTGPMHIAIAVGTPVVALYAVADPKKSGPLYDKGRHRVIQKGRTCDPCVSKKCEYQKCMEAISVEEVEAAINELFTARGKDA
jgi:ADP-heptose:LPS heptosyltransferase